MPSLRDLSLRSCPAVLSAAVLAFVFVLAGCRQAQPDAPKPETASNIETASNVEATPKSETAPVPQAAPASEPQVQARPIPASACAQETLWPFFKAFVIADAVTRAAYSLDGAQAGFRIVTVDNRWSLAVPDQAPGQYPRVELTEQREADGFVMRYVRAEYAPNEDLIRTVGEPRGYRFVHRDGCWRLAGEVAMNNE